MRPSGVTMVGPRNDLYDNVNNTSGSQYYAASFTQKAHSSQWGTTFTATLPTIQQRTSESGANVVLVQRGHNDMRYNTSVSTTLNNARAMSSIP